MEGASWLTFLISKRLFLDKISLQDLKLRIQVRSSPGSSTNKPFQFSQLDIYPKIRERLKKVELENLSLDNVDFQLINISSQDTLHLNSGKLDFQSEDILIDAEKLITADRTFYAGKIGLFARQLQLNRSGNISWQGEVEQLQLKSREQKVNFAVEGLLFLQNRDLQDTLFFGRLQAFSLDNLNMEVLQEQQIARLGKISLQQATILDFSDKEDSTAAVKNEKQAQLKISALSLGTLLPPFIRKVELEELEVKDFNLRQKEALFVKAFNFLGSDILIDSSSAFQEKRFLHTGMASSSFDSLYFSNESMGHHLKVSGFRMAAEGGEGSFSLSGLTIEPEKKERGLWLEGHIEEIKLDKLEVEKLPGAVVKAEAILIQDPDLYVHLPDGPTSASSKASVVPELNLYPAIEDMMQALNIGSVQLKEGSIQLANLGGSGQGLLVPELNLLLDDVLIAETTASEESRILHTKKIQVQLAGLQYYFPDEVYAMELGKLAIGTAPSIIRLEDFRYFVDKTHRAALAAPAREQLYRLSSHLLQIEQINFQKLLQGKGLYAATILSQETDFRIYGDPYAEEEELQGKEKGSPPGPGNDTRLRSAQPFLEKLNLSEKLPGFLPRVEVGELRLEELDIWQMKKVKVENFNLQATAILLDEKPAFAANRFLHARTLSAGFDSLWLYTIEPRQHFMGAGLKFSSANGLGELAVGSFQAIARELDREKGWVEAKIPAFVIEDINTRDIPQGELKIGLIKMDKPKLTVVLPIPKKGEEEKAQATGGPDFYPAISKYLRSLQLGAFQVEEGEIRIGGLGGSTFGLAVPEFKLLLDGVLLAEGTAFSDKRVLHSEDILLQLKNLTYLFPDKVYSLQLGEARMSTADSSLRTKNLRYVYGDNFNLILEAPDVNEVYRFFNKEMLAEGVRYGKLFSNEGFYANKLLADSLNIYVFKNFNYPESGERTPMPAEMIRGAGIPIAIDSLLLRDMEIAYEEMTEGADTAGLVVITEMEALLKDMSNVEEILEEEPLMTVTARGKLMDEGNFETEIKVPLLDKEKLLRVSGSLDTLDATKLNRIARFNSRVAIESGTIYEVLWDFKAGEDLAEGDFEVSYENLSVQLSDSDSPDTTGIIKDIGSFLANSLIIDSSIAEEKTKEPKEVSFKQERDKKRSFFHYYVQALLAGLLEALEVPFQ